MNYTDVSQLGRGTYGIVTHVRAPNGQSYAIKRLDTSRHFGDDLLRVRKRFRREVKFQSGVQHPNVVKIIDYDLDADPPWFVMPLAIGTLEQDLSTDRTLGASPKEPLLDVLAGVEALHNRGLMHRDLKPANILKFRTPDGRFEYKISDLGFATPGFGNASTLTQSNMGGGTPLYRAPECANNFKRATPRADIYSIGAILHDIFDGRQRIPHGPLTVPGPLSPLVAKCTDSASHKRYRSVAALREDLLRILSNESITFESQQEEQLVSLIREDSSLGSSQWDRIFSALDENEDRGSSNFNILDAISVEHISSLFDISPDTFHGLGVIFSRFARSQTFLFEYCDVVSAKAQVFYDRGELDLKASIALAMLEMGTSHNRWRAEHQFLRMAGPDIDDALAQRLAMEVEVRDLSLPDQVQHLEESIGLGWNQLHPRLHSFRRDS